MKKIFLDFETRSMIDLKEFGPDRYVNHPTTEVLSLCWQEEEDKHLYIPPFAPITDYKRQGVIVHKELPTFHNALLIAHNGLAFDALCYKRFMGQSGDWFDTMLAAKIAGRPGGLAKLGKKEDDSALRILMQPKGGKFINGNGVLWRKFLDYNIQDVDTLQEVYQQYEGYYEPEVIKVHQLINNRGIPINTQWITSLINTYEAYKAELQEGIEEKTSINLRSPVQVKQLLEQNGFKVESIQQKYLKDFVLNPEGYRVTPIDHGKEVFSDHTTLFEILEQRREITRALGGKLARVLVMQRDERVRHVLNYYGAHTGRWSGRGLQPHNFAKPVEKLNPQPLLQSEDLLTDCRKTAHELSVSLHPKKVMVSDIVSSLQRTIIQAPEGKTLLIADYSAIEARGTAWIAGEEALLEVFRKGGDIYQDFADKINCSRWLAKQIILGCTYGMSANTFKVFCGFNGIDLDAMGFDSVKLVQSFRDTYQQIRGYWSKVNRIVLTTVQTGRGFDYKNVRFYMMGNTLCFHLPSGRILYYPGAYIEDCLTNWGTLQPVVHYHHHHGGIRKLWGGLITENIVQAICRDILAGGLVAMENEGIPVVLHVHDEIIAEVEIRKAKKLIDRFCYLMTLAKETWAKGFPIDVKGYVSPIYFKSPLERIK